MSQNELRESLEKAKTAEGGGIKPEMMGMGEINSEDLAIAEREPMAEGMLRRGLGSSAGRISSPFEGLMEGGPLRPKG